MTAPTEPRRGPAPVAWLYNPLPQTLRHYEAELRDVLNAVGVTTTRAPVPGVEGLGGSPARRARGALAELAARPGPGGGHLVVCWPVYGLLEPALWLPVRRGSTISIIVHDPSPLRRQVGMGRLSARLGGRAARAGRIRVVAHSEAAAAELTRIGWPPPAVLPHPLFPARAAGPPGPGPGTVLVCGQFKPARDLRLLGRLGPVLRRRGHRTVIAGRGWPEVAGWERIDRFLDEAELDRWIAGSAAVLVPYRHFYQSGIAVRAAELGVPVVGPRHSFLTELYGPGWPGLLADADPDRWADAVSAVAGRSGRVLEAAAAARQRCEQAWAAHLGRAPTAIGKTRVAAAAQPGDQTSTGTEGQG